MKHDRVEHANVCFYYKAVNKRDIREVLSWQEDTLGSQWFVIAFREELRAFEKHFSVLPGIELRISGIAVLAVSCVACYATFVFYDCVQLASTDK